MTVPQKMPLWEVAISANRKGATDGDEYFLHAFILSANPPIVSAHSKYQCVGHSNGVFVEYESILEGYEIKKFECERIGEAFALEGAIQHE